jgi:hypothetical protein
MFAEGLYPMLEEARERGVEGVGLLRLARCPASGTTILGAFDRPGTSAR